MDKCAINELGRHYTPQEVSEAWCLSIDSVRRLFQNEPGVLCLNVETRPGKRRYVTMRIPEDVLKRVYRKLQQS